MKWTILVTPFVGVASLTIAPSLRSKGLTVDIRTPENPPSVDNTATRQDWVSKYKPGTPQSVDATATRQGWVTKYKPGTPSNSPMNPEWEHWLPTGPEYLDFESLEKGYHTQIITMHGSDSWLHPSLPAIKRFFGW
ncbi:hypothetical protein F5Y10DRAFT_240114 [Nemania abortiva]|nr:hypothetical protein F5Y10DRAFT_240114 [Nemania abortiva]